MKQLRVNGVAGKRAATRPLRRPCHEGLQRRVAEGDGVVVGREDFYGLTHAANHSALTMSSLQI